MARRGLFLLVVAAIGIVKTRADAEDVDQRWSSVCVEKAVELCGCDAGMPTARPSARLSPAVPKCCLETKLQESERRELINECLPGLAAGCRSFVAEYCDNKVLRNKLHNTKQMVRKCAEQASPLQKAQGMAVCEMPKWMQGRGPACQADLLSGCDPACKRLEDPEVAIRCCEQTKVEAHEDVDSDCADTASEQHPLRASLIQALVSSPSAPAYVSTTLTAFLDWDGPVGMACSNDAECKVNPTDRPGVCIEGACVQCFFGSDCSNWQPTGEEYDSGRGYCIRLLDSAGNLANKCRTGTLSWRDPCFPGRAQATLEDGSLVAMDQVRVGDRVHVGGGRFEPLLAIIKHEDARVHMVSLEAGNRTLQLTSNHRVQVVDRDGRHQMVAASEVRVRDLMVLADSLAHVLVEAVRVTSRKETVYSPWTASQRLDVDGLMVSTRGSDSKSVEAVDTVALALFQALQRVLPRTTYEALHDTLVPAYSFIGSKVRHASLGPSSLGATVAALLLARQRLRK